MLTSLLNGIGSSWSSLGALNAEPFAMVQSTTAVARRSTSPAPRPSSVASSWPHIARLERFGHWSGVGSGLNNLGFSLSVHDDGSGEALYVGGMFSAAGGVSAVGLARWDGSSWREVGRRSVRELSCPVSGPGLGVFGARGAVLAGGVATGEQPGALGLSLSLSCSNAPRLAATSGSLVQYPREAEVVTMSFFGGRGSRQRSPRCWVSRARTVERDWRFAKAWLNGRLAESEDGR